MNKTVITNDSSTPYYDFASLPAEEIRRLVEERNKAIQDLTLILEKDEIPLLQALESVGVHVSSVWDLVNTRSSYTEAIPVLLEELSKPYHERTKEGIVRALAIKEAKGVAAPALIEEYNRASDTSYYYRWAIGNTVYYVMTPKDIDGIINIVQNKNNGKSRDMFVRSLGKVKSERIENVLIDLLDDDDVVEAALNALRKLKSTKAIEKIRGLTDHTDVLVRKEAKKALEKIQQIKP